MQNYKIRVTQEQSEAIQLRCFELGINWGGDDNTLQHTTKRYLYIGNTLCHGYSVYTFTTASETEISAEDWLELYKSKVSKVHLAPIINELPNTVVHCRTKAESIKLTTLMRDAGWEIPGRQLKWAWESLAQLTCGIGVYQRNAGSYCDVKWYMENGYNIISLSEFYRLQEINILGHVHCRNSLTYEDVSPATHSFEEMCETLEKEIIKCHGVPHSVLGNNINYIRRYMSLQTLTDRQIKSIPAPLLPIYEAGWISDDLSLTSYGKTALQEFLLDENLKKFSAHAAKLVKKLKEEAKNNN
ncbi:hypothetical protein KAU11_09810 [Candidatus Babeliales bacterium]|nr:hypothetical protein [Candidatus Babeliales bacterium]